VKRPSGFFAFIITGDDRLAAAARKHGLTLVEVRPSESDAA
jgi:hypothetical protein